MKISHFVLPKGLLDLPRRNPAYDPVWDAISCHDFYQAVRLVASRYDLEYLRARTKLVELYRGQSTFSMYGICSHALLEDGYVVEQLMEAKEANAARCN